MQKVIRDGKVAVLYSPGYGGGWYNDHQIKELVFHPKLVELVEHNRHEEITEELIMEILNCSENDLPYMGGGMYQLDIEWVDEGAVFRIDEYDGYENVVLLQDHNWLTA